MSGTYGLEASFGHDAQARVTNLTDVVSLSSRVEYGAGERVSAVITPYGTNTFSYFSTNGSRALLISQLGVRHEFFLAGYDREEVVGSAESQAHALNIFLGAGSTVPTNHFGVRNTFYWGPRQFQSLPSGVRSALFSGHFAPDGWEDTDFALGRTRHWLRARTASFYDTEVVLSSVLAMERQPGPLTNGTVGGLITWYDHAGKNDGTSFNGHWEYAPSFNRPVTVAQLQPDEQWQVTMYARNHLGNPVQKADRFLIRGGYDAGWTPVFSWRTNFHLYAPNGIDLLSTHFAAAGTVPHLESSNIYNPHHLVATNYDALGQMTVYEYDDQRRLTNTTYPSGLITSLTYDGSGFLSTQIDRTDTERFRTNSYTWQNGFLHTHTDPRGSVTTNTWDALGRMTATANEAGTSSSLYHRLDLVRVVDRMGFTNLYQYDGFRQLVRHTNANFAVTAYDYCDCGTLESVTDPLNQTTSFTYDNIGRRLRTTRPDSSWSEQAYDALGQVISVTDSAGGTRINWYAFHGLVAARLSGQGLVEKVFYDAENRPTNIISLNGCYLEKDYDALGRVVRSSEADYETPQWLSDTFGYSARGLVAHTNPVDEVTRYFYDALGRKTIETNANLEVTQFSYAPAGDLITLTDAKNHTTTWRYDVLGRVTNKLDHNGLLIFRYAYDANGRLTNRWTPAKGATAYTYDAAGNLLRVDYPTHTDIVLAYDLLNRLTTMQDAAGTSVWSYASGGGVATEDGPWADDTVSYSYTNGLLASLGVTQPGQAAWTTGYGYDTAHRLRTVAAPFGNISYTYRVTENFTHFPWWDLDTNDEVADGNQIARIDYPGGSKVERTFGTYFNRLTGTHLRKGDNTTLNAHEYQHEDSRRVQRQTRTGGAYVDYAYDASGQLTGADGWEYGGTTNRPQEHFRYGYDAAGNLAARTNLSQVQSFSVDELNQLTGASRSGAGLVAGFTTADATSVTVADNGNAAGSATRFADRTYVRTNLTLLDGDNIFVATAQDALARTASVTSTSHLPASVSYSYDSNGNLLSDGRRHFTYDDENQLTAVVVTNRTKSEFVYDGKMRRRVRKEFAWTGQWQQTLEVRYLYDGNLVVQERHFHGTPVTSYPQRTVTYTRGLDLSGTREGAGGIGGLLARTEISHLQSPTHAFYHSDMVGNVTALVDPNQQVVARYLYEPFGAVIAMSGPLATANTYRFSSKEAHDPSGLVYYLYRYYEPALQRWVNRDPIGERGGVNLYRFVRNSSLQLVDKYGLWTVNQESGFRFVLPCNRNKRRARFPMTFYVEPCEVVVFKGHGVGTGPHDFIVPPSCAAGFAGCWAGETNGRIPIERQVPGSPDWPGQINRHFEGPELDEAITKMTSGAYSTAESLIASGTCDSVTIVVIDQIGGSKWIEDWDISHILVY